MTVLRWLAITLMLALALTVYRLESASQQALVRAEHVADSSHAVAMRAVSLQKRAEQALVGRYATAQAHASVSVADFQAMLQTLSQTVADSVADSRLPVLGNPPGLTIVGLPLAPLDTVVTLGYVRRLADAGQAAVDSLLTERSVAVSRIGVLVALAAAQDTALVRADTLIAANRRLVAVPCRVLGMPCPSRRVSFGLGVAIPVFVRLLLR